MAATGWGFTVFPCFYREAFVAAKKWFADRQDSIATVLVEEWIDVKCSWCVGIAVRENETVCFGGAEQIFSAPTRQSGSVIDPQQALPPEGEALAVAMGEVARHLGFRGIAGLDIGQTIDGRLMVFDPNFRIASSTSQLLFHPAASKRVDLPVSQSFQVTPLAPFDEIANRLHKPIDEGWFVPTRFFNGEKHPLSGGKHIITGFVLGADRNLAVAASQRLQETLLP